MPNDAMRALVAYRFGKAGLLVNCADCVPLRQRANNKGDEAMASDAGSLLIRTAEAFASRDMGEGAFDSTGAWHPGVVMYRTCKWVGAQA